MKGQSMTAHDARMGQSAPLYNSVAPLRNVSALATLLDRLESRTAGLPGMGCFYGPSGYGKTSAAIFATNTFRAVNVQVQSTWSGKFLCQQILRELGETPKGTIAGLVARICELLAIQDVPLIIDEADHLVRRQMIEIVRDIYEGSAVPVVLIGEEEMPQKLRQWERVHNRILSWVPAEQASLSDLHHLVPIYAPGIGIDPDLAEAILRASGGSIRRICVNLNTAAEMARTRNLDAVDLAAWGSAPFFTGSAPAARRGLA